MKRTPIVLLSVMVSGAGGWPAAANLQIFACEPEWAALAKEIGGEKVKTFAATHARQDPHHIRARPSLIAKVRRAHLIFCSGAGLEAGWLPILLQRGAPARTQPGQLGHFMAAKHVRVLGIPARIDRALGDIHPDGNPHVHLDPRNLLALGKELVRRLVALDGDHADYYRARGSAFHQRLKSAIAGWEVRAARLHGMPVIVHHKSWAYLIDWLKLNRVATLEPKPGLPPTSSHLESLLRLARAQRVAAILRTPYDPETASRWLSSKLGIPAVKLPYSVGGNKETTTLTAMFERTLMLLEALGYER